MKKIAFLIILPLLFSCLNEKKSFWKDTSELQGTWVNLERDQNGYLIYNPCDSGYKSSIVVDKGEIIIRMGHEGADTLKISSVEILNSLNEIEIFGNHEYYSIKSTLKIIDFEKKLYLFKWEIKPSGSMEIRNGKMMMTRKEFESDFRFIDNPCDSGRVPEKKFLPVEY